jgi:hypothetical protein
VARRGLLSALAALFLLAHLASLPTTPDDIDAVNFALGVREFDVARHQPHPPGYPLFIALGKISTPLLRAVGVASPEIRGLSLWSALGGAVLLLFLFELWRRLDGDPWRPLFATLIAAASPLAWFTSLRPLSDVPGLCLAVGSLALLVRAAPAHWTGAEGPSHRVAAVLLGGAFVAGLAAGVRSQTVLLTAPFLGMMLMAPRSGVPLRVRAGALVAVAAGVLLWGVPLVLASGGLVGYSAALGSQAGEDFSGVVMLWTHRTVRVAALALLNTLVLPWDSPVIAGVVLALAAAGALLLLARAPGRALLIALLFGPYALFHLLFQETVTVRYALPLVLPLAYLASIPIAQARPWVSVAAASALIGAMLWLAVPAGLAYGREPGPVFSLLEQIADSDSGAPIGMHRRAWTESRRARQWSGVPQPDRLLAAPRDYEWLELARVWREQDLPTAWFVADPRRTDLALIDPASQQRASYRWPFRSRTYVGGARPDALDLVEFTAPGWFLGPGWALTPEVAGITERDGWGPHKRPSAGWVRRRSGESVLMIGGRHLGSPGSAPAQVSVALDRRAVLTLDVPPGPFLRFYPLPAGALAGDGRYSEVSVTAASADGLLAPVAIEQFNLQDSGSVQLGFDQGWQEPEYSPATGRSWRWMSERGTLVVVNGDRDVTLRMSGESPLRYFSRPSRLSIEVGGETLAVLELAGDFTGEVRIPAALLAKSNGRVTLSADQMFIPGDRTGSADRRHLAVRIYSVTTAAH